MGRGESGMTDLTDDLDLIRRLRREYPPWTLVPVAPATPAPSRTRTTPHRDSAEEGEANSEIP